MNNNRIFFITVILGFCSLNYELLLAQTLTEFVGYSIRTYTLTIGLYILGLGVGASSFPLIKKYGLILNLVWLEIILVILASTSFLGLLVIAEITFSSTYILLVGFSVVFFIGYLSGLEIPFLQQLVIHKNAFGSILGWDFIGSLIAALAFPLIFYPLLDLYLTSICIAVLNILVILLLNPWVDFSARINILLIIILSLFVWLFSQGNHIATKMLSSIRLNSLFEMRMEPASESVDDDVMTQDRDEVFQNIEVIDSFKTLYQRVMFLNVSRLSTFMPPGHYLYLDRSIQLDDSWILDYHETMSMLSLSFIHKQAPNIAVIGGGDGILLHHLVTMNPKVTIDLIDIDQQFLDYMKDHAHYRQFHKNSFDLPQVNVHVTDGYAFMRQNVMGNATKAYDVVILDLPGIRTDDRLLSLYSTEFYHFIRESLAANGYLVTWYYPYKKHLAILHKTLFSSGFSHYLNVCSYSKEDARRATRNQKPCGEYFMAVAQNDIFISPTVTLPLTQYQKGLLSQYEKKAQVLLDTPHRANSIFQPNYGLLITPETSLEYEPGH